MTKLSLFRRLLGRVACLSAVALFSAPSCEHACSGIACLDGLNITFDDSFDQSRTFQIELAHAGGAFMTCTLSPPAASGLGQVLVCSSALGHSEHGKTLRLPDFRETSVTVTVSSGGTILKQQIFQTMFVTSEINGPGCGTCTQASITASAA